MGLCDTVDKFFLFYFHDRFGTVFYGLSYPRLATILRDIMIDEGPAWGRGLGRRRRVGGEKQLTPHDTGEAFLEAG